MKKTEKIEIRISHEEKERLSAMAAREGTTVSTMMRELANRYVDANRSYRTRPRLGMASFAVAGLVGMMGVGLGLTTPAVMADNPDEPYKITAELRSSSARPGVSTSLPVNPNRIPAYYVLDVRDSSMPGLTLRIDFRESEVEDGAVKLVLCERPDTNCGEIAEQVLGYRNLEQAEVNFQVNDDLVLTVRMSPQIF